MVNFKGRLKDKFLPKIKGILKYNKKEKLYQKSFGTYVVKTKGGKNLQGRLLVEFNVCEPKDGIYYGFKITGITRNYIDEIDKLFAPFLEHLEFELKKDVYPAENIYGNHYWVFWLRAENAIVDDIIHDMEFIRDCFNMLILFSHLNIRKV